MGKVKSWLMEMEQDAINMSQEAWCGKHGESLIDVYINARIKYDRELQGEREVVYDE